MENTRIEVTPLNVSYASKKTLNILIKFRRVLISTNYELEKFECKKPFQLKDSFIELSSYAPITSYGFKLSRELELANTKIDAMIFGLENNKNLNLLGKATLDLGLFLNDNFREKSIYRELKIGLDKSEDTKAYLTMGIFIENIGKSEQISTRKTSKPSHETSNNIKTESHHKETMLINRKKKADVPSAYEISRKNYKQTEITRTIEDRSKSKTRDGSGSYKKRFEYQYSRQATKEDDEQPQAPPSQRPQLKEERGSPMPRIKTPEPISDTRLSFQSQRQAPKTERNPSNLVYSSSPNQVCKYQSNIPPNYHHNEHLTRHKIIIDVEHSRLDGSNRKYLESKSRYEEEVCEEDSDDYGREESYDASRFSTFNPHQENSRSNIGKIEHVNKYHEEHEKEVGLKSKQNKLNQYQGSSGKKQDVHRDREEKGNNLSYGGYHHSKSFDEEYPKPPKETVNSSTSNYQQEKQNQNRSEENKAISTPSNQNTKKDNNYTSKQQNETIQTNTRNNKTVESIRDKSSNNKQGKEEVDQFRDINRKFEFIQNHINSKKSSPNHDKSQNSQSYQKEDTSFEQNKKHQSPSNMNKNDPKGLEKEHVESSANTFNENHFESNLESSPDRHNTTDTKYIKSFTFEPDDLNKNSIDERVGTKGKEKKNQKMFESSIQTYEKVNESKASENVVNNSYQDSKDNRITEKQLKDQNGEKNIQNNNENKSNPTQNKVHQIHDQGMQTIKNNIPKIKSNSITTSLQLKIPPSNPQTKLEKKSSLDSSKERKEHDLQALKKNYEERIIGLENELDEKEESFRKEMMEKDLELRNQLKEEEKNKEMFADRIKVLEEENEFLKNMEKELLLDEASSKKNLRESWNGEELNRLKRENERLKDLNVKLNTQLEESDEKQFEIETSIEKKELEFKRKMGELEAELKNKQKELKEFIDKFNQLPISKPEATSLKNFQEGSNGSIQYQNKNTLSQGELKSYQEEYLTEKKKNVNLESQIRQKDNDLRFHKIRIENLLKDKKDLEDEIDNIVSNNKHELARQGSIHKINMESASVSNSVQVENKVLKEQVGNLQKQVQELNSLLEGLITEGSVNEERLSSNKDTATLENYHNLSKKYDAVEKKCEAYEEEVKNSHIKIGQIMNIIFSHNDRELIDEVQKLL